MHINNVSGWDALVVSTYPEIYSTSQLRKTSRDLGNKEIQETANTGIWSNKLSAGGTQLAEQHLQGEMVDVSVQSPASRLRVERDGVVSIMRGGEVVKQT